MSASRRKSSAVVCAPVAMPMLAVTVRSVWPPAASRKGALSASVSRSAMTLTPAAGSLAAPKNAQKAFDKGVEAVKNKKNEEAAKNFEEAVKLYPQYAEAWYELGRVQASLNQAAASRQSFDAALKADPSYTPPYMKIAQLEQ